MNNSSIQNSMNSFEKTASANQSHGNQNPRGDASAPTTKLDQFVNFAKENWRPLMKEMVAAGVTAYLAHSLSDKNQK